MDNHDYFELQEIVSKYYQIGELVGYEKDTVGIYNTNYAIDTIINGRKSRYFLKKYRKGRRETEIRFEHSVVNHLVGKNIELVAPIINTRDGKTYVKQFKEGSNGDSGTDVFYTISEYIQGDVTHIYVNPNCSDKVLRSVATVLARFHEAVVDLNPAGRRYEPVIIDLLPQIAKNVRNCTNEPERIEFNDYLLENHSLVHRTIDRTLQAIGSREYEKMPHLVIHGDYHPGNLKFKNDTIVGLFDFDWSKIEVRCYDVALALVLFCTAWEGKSDGDLQLGKAITFLNAYQDTLSRSQGIDPLSDVELRYLPHMISASNIYLLNWLIGDYCIDPEEYLRYLKHTVRIMRWLEGRDNQAKLEKLIMMIDNMPCDTIVGRV